MSLRCLLVLVLVFAAACSSPPPRKAMAVESIPTPATQEQKKLTLRVGGSGTAYATEAVAVEGDGNMVRVFGEGTFTVIGRAVGSTRLRFVAKDGHADTVDVEIVPGDPPTRAIIVGETITLSMKDVKEYSVGLADIVATNQTGRTLVVTGKKPGTTTILFLGNSGKQQAKHEIVVVGGRRWF
jgi:hypothetical protein